MKSTNRLPISIWLIILLIGCAFSFPIIPWAGGQNNLTLDFDDSDPVEYRALIMEINYEKAQLVVAEDPIWVVDLLIGEQRFATRVIDAKERPQPLSSFKPGDMVFVQGFKNSDGVVFAALIQKIKFNKEKVEQTPNVRPKHKKDRKSQM
ncbi:MAG: hypothetical protein JSV83_20150 [Desulfobacterales bacterium]|nr:MAG: hypothetical protein JSV83_20150 [Desulfobacterales bacterium]